MLVVVLSKKRVGRGGAWKAANVAAAAAFEQRREEGKAEQKEEKTKQGKSSSVPIA